MCTPSNLDSWIQNYHCRCQTFKRNEMTHRVKKDITWESSRVRALFDEEMRVWRKRKKSRSRERTGRREFVLFSRALSIAIASLFWAEECCKPGSHYVLDVCITRRNCLVCKCSIFYPLWRKWFLSMSFLRDDSFQMIFDCFSYTTVCSSITSRIVKQRFFTL